MKKLIAMTLALFMLLSSAALSEEPSNTVEPFPYVS